MADLPEHLGKYRLDSVLGKGAMGMVYRAYDPHIARTVALKTIRKELFGDAQQADLISRFKNEAQAAGRLTHPNIVAVYDYGEDDSSAYIAMEYVEGQPLNTLLAAQQPSPPRQAMAWMEQLLAALAYAHARGVVHRDIKPANLLITAESQLKISDFGIARVDTSTLTQTGSMIGTPSYMSPEQFRGEPVDGRSDVFSAAIVLYQLLTGARAFSGSATVVMQQILNQMPAPPSSLNPALDPALDAILAQALAKLPEQRYATAQLFLDALRGLDADGALPAGATQPNAAPAAPAAAATVGVAATGAGTAAPDDEDDDRTMLVGQPGMFAPPPAAGVDSAAHDTGAAHATGIAGATLTPWKLAALPELETLLTHQIGPMARLLLKRAAAQATDLATLCSALLPHIPSERGRQQFERESGQLRQRLEEQAQEREQRKRMIAAAEASFALQADVARQARADGENLGRNQGDGNESGADQGGGNDGADNNGAERVAAAAASAHADADADAGSANAAADLTGYDQAFADATQRRLAAAIGPIAKVLVTRTARRSALRDEFLQLLAEHIDSAAERDAFLRDMHKPGAAA